jgi:hypothetical protein
VETAVPIPLARTYDAAGVAALIAEHFQKIGEAQTREERNRAMDSFAGAVIEANLLTPVLTRLINQDENGKRMALEIGSRLPRVHDSSVRELLLPLLKLSQLSSSGRTLTAARLLAPTIEASSEANQILHAYTADTVKAKMVERLQRLQELLPQRNDLANRIALLQTAHVEACPKCGTLLPQHEMISHVWKSHGLLSDGGRFKEPWQLISDWLGNYEETRKIEWLSRCCEIAHQIDPKEGYARVRRMLLADENALGDLREEGRLESATSEDTLCPECLASNVAKERPVHPVAPVTNHYDDHGFRIELEEGLFGGWLYLQTPQGMLYNATEPARVRNPKARQWLIVFPLVLIATICAFAIPKTLVSPLIVAGPLLGLAAIVFLLSRSKRQTRPIPQRIIDHTWGIVGPTLHQPEFVDFDSFFLSDLATTSVGQGDPRVREGSLQRLTQLTLSEVQKRPRVAEALAPLIELQLDDARRMRRDLTPLFAQQLGLLMQGILPIAHGEGILRRIPFKSLSRSDRARLRVLILGYAFEIGWEVADLRRLGRILPALGQLFASEDVDGMARLRWLWQAKSMRPWQRIGTATTVFDLARYPMMAGSYLETNPDLLLFQTLAGSGNTQEAIEPILICEEGVVFQKAVITGMNVGMSIAAPSGRNPQYRLNLPDRSLNFNFDPSWIASRLQAWAQFLYREFLSQAPLFVNRRSPRLLDKLLQQKLMTCTECQSPFMSMNGNLGISLNELEVRS